jgi:methionyl aminopeptidase
MSIEQPEDLEGMRRAGEVVRDTLAALSAAVQPGVTTLDLDRLAQRVFERYGARSAPRDSYGFPGTVLISINDEAVHGIPGSRRLERGDMVSLDVTPELNGYIADAATTLIVPPVTTTAHRLVQSAQRALEAALATVRHGTPLRELGRTIERRVHRDGFEVIRSLAGHGVGRAIHEAPNVWNFAHPFEGGRLHAGQVIAIEPIIAAGSGEIVEGADGWTVRTRDGSLSAHVEHTLLVTHGAPRVLTA